VKAAEIGFAALLVLVSAVYAGMALRMPQGHLSYPGPGFFPAVVGLFFVATALACAVQALLTPAQQPEAAASGAGRAYRKTVQLLACLAAYGVALRPVGFPLSLAVFLVAAVRIFGLRRWPLVLAIAGGLTFVSYVAFVGWLKVPLPLGVLGDLLE
jgi:putative tricarboxylic transport membrane protein